MTRLRTFEYAIQARNFDYAPRDHLASFEALLWRLHLAAERHVQYDELHIGVRHTLMRRKAPSPLDKGKRREKPKRRHSTAAVGGKGERGRRECGYDTDLGHLLRPSSNPGRPLPCSRSLPEARESQSLLVSRRHRPALREVLRRGGGSRFRWRQ